MKRRRKRKGGGESIHFMVSRKSVNLCKSIAVLLVVRLFICVQHIEGGDGGGGGSNGNALPDHQHSSYSDFIPSQPQKGVCHNSSKTQCSEMRPCTRITGAFGSSAVTCDSIYNSSLSFVNVNGDCDEHATSAANRSTLSSKIKNRHDNCSSSESTSMNNNNSSMDTEMELGHDLYTDERRNIHSTRFSFLPPLHDHTDNETTISQNRKDNSCIVACTTTIKDANKSITTCISDVSNLSCVLNKSCFDVEDWSTGSSTADKITTISSFSRNDVGGGGGGKNVKTEQHISLLKSSHDNASSATRNELTVISHTLPTTSSIPYPPSMYHHPLAPLAPLDINGTSDMNQKRNSSCDSTNNLKRLLQQLEVREVE